MPRPFIAGLAALVLALAVVVLAIPSGHGSATAGALTFEGSVRPADPAPPLSLRDQDGHPVSLAAERGHVVILTFLATARCPNVCQAIAQQIRGALDTLSGPVPALAVSVDPSDDTNARARAFVTRQSLRGRLRLLLGPPNALAHVWKAYAIIAPTATSEQEFDDSEFVLLIDPQGLERVGFTADTLTPEKLAHDVQVLERGG
jgi:cytochrome oxidase Cu insertion factor (SCO1/SenC/PrrC family)